MKTKRLIVLLAFALALGLGTQALAQDEIEVSASLIASDPKAPRTRYAVVPGRGFFKSVDGAGSRTFVVFFSCYRKLTGAAGFF